jgi:hypothetical protein
VSKRKANNSILFLTTLGVYLGLVLAGGAAPQVYANAAMTRNFDIVDEIEYKDDLDNKPDDERSDINLSVQVYLEDVEQFLIALDRLAASKQFDLSSDHFEVVQASSLPCVASNKEGSYTPVKFDNRNAAVNPFLERFSKQANYGYSLADCVGDPHFKGEEASGSKLLLTLDSGELTLQVAVKRSSPQSAATLVPSLTQTFARFRKEATELRQSVIEHTSVHADNDQVFVITRLPRGSLDPLFAKGAK